MRKTYSLSSLEAFQLFVPSLILILEKWRHTIFKNEID